MKYLRYIILAVLVYLLVFSLRSYLMPIITLASGDSPGDNDFSEVIAHFRSTLLPWVALISLLFVGWLFATRKLIVYGALSLCVPLFAYLAYSSISSLGYTPGQSLLAITQGYGGSRVAWLLFYLVALVALPFANRMKSSEQGGDGDAEEAV